MPFFLQECVQKFAFCNGVWKFQKHKMQYIIVWNVMQVVLTATNSQKLRATQLFTLGHSVITRKPAVMHGPLYCI